MSVLSILSAPWAILPAKLQEIAGVYAAHVRGERVDLAALEARLGRPLNNTRTPYTVDANGTALVQMSGVLAKKANMMTDIRRGTSMQVLAADLEAAAADPTVKAIVLAVDSPGGTVDGTQALAATVARVAAQKPVVAWADGVMASAAYWIGSAASEIVVSGETTQVGSIGVVARHTDLSGAQAKEGIKTTEITAGKYKRIASEYAPLDAEGAAYLQGQVDEIYRVFVNAVAENRGAKVEDVLANMADGRVFLGAEAVSRGLVDRMASLSDTLARVGAGDWPAARGAARNSLAASSPATATPAVAAGGAPLASQAKDGDSGAVRRQPPTDSPPSGAQPASASPSLEGATSMDLATLNKDHPELAAALRAEGAAAERERIAAVRAQSLPGHEDLIEQLAADGKTTGPEAAVAVLNAERKANGARVLEIRNGRATAQPAAAAESVDAAARAAAKPAPEEEAEANLPLEQRCEAKWGRDPALRAEFADSFEAYLAFERANSAGQVRVLKNRVAA